MATPVLIADDGCDRATAYHMSNKIIRRADGLFVTWLDNAYRNRVAKVTPETGEVSPAMPVAQGFDNHCGAAMALTPDNRVHIVSGSHHTGLLYWNTANPAERLDWSIPQAIGCCATYPSLVSNLAGNLHLAHRYAPMTREGSERWGTVWFRKAGDAPWRGGRILTQAPAPLYSYPTNTLAMAADGTLHLVIEWYKTYPKDAHEPHSAAVSHLESPDGEKWFHTDGRDVKHFPVCLEDTEPILFRGADNLRPGNVAVTPAGAPLAGLWSQATNAAMLAVRDPRRRWRVTELDPILLPLTPGARFLGQPQIAVDRSGLVILVAPMGEPGEWGKANTQLHVFRLQPEDGKVVSHYAIDKAEPDQPDWLPSIEKTQLGRHFDEPYLLYMTGRRGETCINDTTTKVHLVKLQA